MMAYIKKYIKNHVEILKLKQKTNCKLEMFVEVKGANYICLGNNVRIGEHSKLLCWKEYTSGLDVQKLKPSLIIGDNFNATSNLLIQCAGKIEIGNDVLIGRNVSILDYNHDTNPNMKNYLDNNLKCESVKIGDGVWIGNNVIILPGTHIGKKCIVGAGSVVTSNLDDYCIAVGIPAKTIKKYNFDKKKWVSVNEKRGDEK